MGNIELTALKPGQQVPVAAVRLRRAFLKRLAEELKSKVLFCKMQSDTETAKELQVELNKLQSQVNKLTEIRAPHDIDSYARYIEQFVD